MTRHATPVDLATYWRATSNGARPLILCRHCGDSFFGPERDCPSPDAGRAPYKDSGRGGHRFDPVEPEPRPRKPMTAERLLQIAELIELLGVPVSPDPMSPAGIIPELLAEVNRLQAECKRLQRVGLENARVGGDPVFTREQIDRIMDDDASTR